MATKIEVLNFYKKIADARIAPIDELLKAFVGKSVGGITVGEGDITISFTDGTVLNIEGACDEECNTLLVNDMLIPITIVPTAEYNQASD